MPIPIQGFDSGSAKSELGKSALAAFTFGISTETGFNIAGNIASKAFRYGLWKPTKGIAKAVYNGRGTFKSIAGFGLRSAYRGVKMYAPQARDVAGGVVTGAYKGASWLYKHPVASIGIAGGAGALWGAGDIEHQPVQDAFASPSIVEAMGGQSDYGVRGLMQNMNASGDMVFGMNARR